jgi:hypothetical protein
VADNTVINAGTGGDTIRDKDRTGVKTPIVALDLNPAETLMAGTMPVSLASVPTVTEKQDQTAMVQTTWTSATALNTTTATYACTGYGTANVGITVPATATAGAVTIEVSQDGGTVWVPAPAIRQDNGVWESPIPLAYFVGTNGSRIYAVSVDAFTHIRVKLTTAIVGAGNTVVTITVVAGGIEPFVTQRARKIATYRAVFRVAASIYQFSQALVANTRKQVATIHHAAASTKTVRIRSCWFYLTGHNAAALTVIDLERITTAPATGNPAITPTPAGPGDAAAEATCLLLPTTQATAGAVYSMSPLSAAAAAAAPTLYSDIPAPAIDLMNPTGVPDPEAKLPEIRAGVLEGWAVTLTSSAAPTVSGFIVIEFTEEAP